MSRSGLPQLNFSDFEPQIFWLIVSFFILFFLIKKVITPYFFSEIESRDAYVQDGLLKVQKLQMQANHLACEYKEKLRLAHIDASHIVSKMKFDVIRQLEDTTCKLSKEANDAFQKVRFGLEKEEMLVEKEIKDHFPVLLRYASDKILMPLSERLVEVKAKEVFEGVTS